MQHQSPIGPPGVSNSALYPQLPRSSPTTATAIASATVTIQNVSNTVPPFVARGAGANAVTHFQNQYPVNANDYPTNTQRSSKHHTNMQYQMHHQNYNSDVYNSEQQHLINNHQNMMMPSRSNEVNRNSRSHVRQNYHQQQYNQHYYNYNKNHHNSDSSYQHMNTQSNYNHSYGYNNHYGYHHTMYSSENNDNMIGNHMNQDTNYYQNENLQHTVHKNQNHVDYPSKNNHEYYSENNMYNHMTQAEGYVPSEGFQQSVPNTATAIAAASAAVMTPPTSVQTDSSENYSNFHQFYNTDTPQTQAPATSGDNSNSSADFNFLSNLANDFAPEYYQLS